MAPPPACQEEEGVDNGYSGARSRTRRDVERVHRPNGVRVPEARDGFHEHDRK